MLYMLHVAAAVYVVFHAQVCFCYHQVLMIEHMSLDMLPCPAINYAINYAIKYAQEADKLLVAYMMAHGQHVVVQGSSVGSAQGSSTTHVPF